MLNNLFIFIIILLSYTTILSAKNKVKEIDISNIKSLNLELESKQKTKADYKKKDNLLNEPLKKEEYLKSKNKNDVDFDGTVDFNKDRKEIENVKINLGKNF
ncbi:hypothetical protein [uncultured Arcobacter sp.]|uniref:hypothetical protein n=1 Tax=uncultured Arcobacter sp. TaxID=165434 RepID=UPI0026163E93|nr:hypothetical protein [uncultured Arcobacter sp.]